MILVIVSALPAISDLLSTVFPGHKTFLSFCHHVGIPIADLEIVYDGDARFDSQIAASSAPIALCLGPDAFEAFTGLRMSINSTRGFVFQPEDCQAVKRMVFQEIGVYKSSRKNPDGTFHHKKGDPRCAMRPVFQPRRYNPALKWIIPTLDPFAIQSDPRDMRPALKADLLRAKRFHDSVLTSLTPRPIILQEPGTGGMLTLDIETVGFEGPVHRIGLATDTGVCSMPWNTRARDLTQAAIDQAQTIQGHNLAFDIPRLESEGIDFGKKPRFDTMLAAQMLGADMPKRLEFVATLYLDIPTWKHLSGFDQQMYNTLDTYYTHHIGNHQRDDLKRTGQFDLFTHTIMPATSVLIKMTRLGIKVNVDGLWIWRNDLNLSVRRLTQEWNDLAPGVLPSSYSQLSKLFYKTLALDPIYVRRKKNKVSTLDTSEEAVRTLRTKYPQHAKLLTCLLDLREVSKQLSTYASVDLSLDDCVHPRYLPANKNSDDGTTVTGRIASTGPNIQNQIPESKALFIPHWPDWWFLEFDFSQIELRIAAVLSDDKTLQKDLEGDVHARIMDRLGVDRTRAKNLIYGSLYGAGPGKLVKVLRARGITATFDECSRLQDTLSRTYPRLWAWRSSVAAEGAAARFLTNPFGRRRYFRRSKDQTPEMYDFLPQSTAADILWSLLLPLEEAAERFGGFFLTTTHDSGLFEFPRASLTPALISCLRGTCERDWPIIAPGFRVPTKWKVGRNWRDMHPVDESSIQAIVRQAGRALPAQVVPADGPLAGP